ncbi:uncharacterized protein LOC110368198 isoform X1 [Fundulus heteroclitus]|nr:uncharacterized protein LOC110368198 isoform X1 [Fundulus heteroclitus]XP_035985849.1 uncharacterized protein LOC110368198 isoform X1 [Fundulus heteroclitus]
MERQKDPLLVFLQDRGTNEEVLRKLQNDKIDSSVITLMSDEDLATYIPHYGDRLAAVAFCRMNHRQESAESNRKELLEKIREKCCAPGSKAVKRMHTFERLRGNKNEKKTAKRVELGWMNFNEKENSFKQVRSVKGGGTRHISVDRQAKVSDIQEMAESLFFPNGVCRSLNLADHVCSIHDFAQNEMDPDVTVEDLYEKTKVKLLRLYLCTKRNVKDAKSVSNSQQLTTLEVVEDCPHNGKEDQGSDQEVIIDLSLLPDSDVFDLMNPQSEILIIEEPPNVAIDNKVEDEIVVYEEMEQDQAVLEVTTECTRTDQAEGRVIDIAQSLPEVHDAQMQCVTYSDDEVTVGMPFSDSADLDDTLPWEQSKPMIVIVVQRGNCLSDLLAAFLDPDIMNKEVHIKRKLPNGELEQGEGSGVVRDCLSEFWGEFYSKCTLGANVKTPFLRHEYQVEEWQAIARILVTGWITVRYFPLLLPLPFLEETLYGTIYSSVTESFLQYVSKEERETLELALNCFEAVDKDDLVDVLDAHDCHQRATKDNIARLVSQLGHKTLIQTPMFVIKSWKPILKILKDTLFPHKLVEITEERIPTPKRVKQLLKFPEEMTAIQNNVARHLKRYIGECDKGLLEAFLRFCTGADILFGQNITVQFIETTKFQCRPQAHTCGCLLMLPVNYQNYPDLRTDFDLVLRSGVWVMDII